MLLEQSSLCTIPSASVQKLPQGLLGLSVVVATAKKKYLLSTEYLSLSHKITFESVCTKKKCYQEMKLKHEI